MLKKLTILTAALAMLLTASAPLVLAQSEDLLDEDDVLRCLIPEGCDTNGDGIPDLRAGEPAPPETPGGIQYDNAADGPPEIARCLYRLPDGFCLNYVSTDGGIVNATPPAP